MIYLRVEIDVMSMCETGTRKIATRHKNANINHRSFFCVSHQWLLQENTTAMERNSGFSLSKKKKRRRRSGIEKVLHAWEEREKKHKLKVNRRQQQIFHLNWNDRIFVQQNSFLDNFCALDFCWSNVKYSFNKSMNI